jgi:DNA-binding PadR family transcriptional regulator
MSQTQIDAKSVRFLNAVRYYGDEANITQIRAMTGLNRNEANYRFTKLEDLGLIEVTKEQSPGDNPDRKVAHLTGAARRELERGLGSATTAGLVISDAPKSDEVSRERFREMEETIAELKQAQKAAAFDARDDNGEEKVPREEFEEFEDYVYEWNDAVETYLRALRSVVERFLPGVDDLSEYFDEDADRDE